MPATSQRMQEGMKTRKGRRGLPWATPEAAEPHAEPKRVTVTSGNGQAETGLCVPGLSTA